MKGILILMVLITGVHKFAQSQQQTRQKGGWVSDGSKAIEIRNHVLSLSIPTIQNESSDNDDEDDEYRGMWVDGTGANFGEHYWTIKLKRFEKFSKKSTATVGLSNWNFFDHGPHSKGLFFSGGHLKSSGQLDSLLIENFGPTLSEGDSVGILASFENSDDRLQVYLFLNDKPLGLAFDIPASALPNAYPVVSFVGAEGSAKIRRELEVPSLEERNPVPKKYSGIAGSWRMIPSTITINGEINKDKNFDPTVFVRFSPLGGNWYNGSLHVVNHITFGIEKTKNTWQNFGRWSRIPIGFSTKYGHLERWMKTFLNNPDKVIFVGSNQITVVKGNSRVTFSRFDDSTKGFSGNPFH